MTLLFVFFLALAPAAMAASGPHGTVNLINEQSAIQPGRSFRAGLHFQLEKGWHIYWLNPGDSGEPPKVRWSLPKGFRAGPLEWPAPRRIEDHSLIDYGYEDEVLLPAKIHPPAHLPAGHKAELSVDVTWLVCREICIPGRATLNLSVPIRKEAPSKLPANQKLFAKWLAQIPKPAPKEWRLKGTLKGPEFIVEVETGRREKRATFFPFEPNQIENAAAQNSSPLPRGIRLELQRSDQLQKPPPFLAGVLVLGPARSYVIKIPVRTSQ